MADYVYYLLLGSAAGAIIAAFGLGLLVTYQGSGVVNFAHGAMATWAGYVYADLRRGAYPWPVPGFAERYYFAGGDVGAVTAILLAVGTSLALALVVHLAVFRPLAKAPELARVVASIGVLIMVMALVDRRFPDNAGLRVDPILPRDPVRFSDDIVVSSDGLWLAGIVIAIAAAIAALSRFTRLGLATRAAATNEKGAILLGYSPDLLAAASFVLASAIGSVVVILASPMVQLSTGVFTFGFLIPALGAALLGRFRSITLTVGVGLLIGAVQSTFTKLQVDLDLFPDYGAREGLPFVIIIVAMAVLGERLPSRGSTERWRLPKVPEARFGPWNAGVAVVAAVVGLLVLGPLWRGAILTSMIAIVLALSLVVLTGFAGQPSLAQMAFAGVGGFALSKLTTGAGVPFPIAPILAASVAMVFGVAVGVPALRVRGTNLAIVTLAGGVAIAEFVFKNPRYVGDASTGGAEVPNPSLFGWDLGLVSGSSTSRPVFGLLVLAVTVAVALVVVNLRRSPSGRRILATRSNERAAAAIGIPVAGVKLQAYAISSFIAGLGGCLIGYRFGQVSDASFGVVASLTLLAFAYLGGVGSVSGAVVAGLLSASGVMFFATSRLSSGVGPWETFIGGTMLVVTAVLNPEGLAGGVRRLVGRSGAVA